MESTSGTDEHREINEASTSGSDSSHQAQVRSFLKKKKNCFTSQIIVT